VSRGELAVQTEDSENFDLDLLTCPVLLTLFFEPVMAVPCGHLIEEDAKNKLETPGRCPCCRESVLSWIQCPPTFRNMLQSELQKAISERRVSYHDIHFNSDHFVKIVGQKRIVDDKGKVTQEEGLKTPTGLRFITLLENAPKHLNQKPVTRTESADGTVTESVGKSAIEILSSTPQGRGLLRKKLHIDVSGKFFFGRTEILPTSLMIQTNGKSIREWLSMTTAMEKFEKDALERIEAITEEERIITAQKERLSNQFRLFLSRGAQGGAAAGGSRMHSEAINPVLQHVAYGEESRVRDALESVKRDPAQLAALLSDTGTVKDYSDRIITGMTLLQAAAAAGDIDMCLMLKNYMSPEEFATQLAEIFPNGIEAHETDQQRNTFNFDAILAAIRAATPADLDAALNKIGAEFTQSDSARAKPDHELSLIEALNRFREQFAQHSHSEKIFNPQHLLRAFEVYNALWNQCERDGSDRDYKKRDLFWRQIIGYTQRFMPACYAQAFAQGLYYLVKVDQDASWRPEPVNRALKLKHDNFSYFPLPVDPRSGLGFDFAIYVADLLPWAGVQGRSGPARAVDIFSKTFVEQKQQACRTLCREFECSRATSLMNVVA